MNTNILSLFDYRKRIYLSFFFVSTVLIISMNLLGYVCFKIFYNKQYRLNEKKSLSSLSYLIENSDSMPAIKTDDMENDQLYIVDRNGFIIINFTSPNYIGLKASNRVIENIDADTSIFISLKEIDDKKCILSYIPISSDRYLIHVANYSNISAVYYRVRRRFIMVTLFLIALSYFLTRQLSIWISNGSVKRECATVNCTAAKHEKKTEENSKAVPESDFVENDYYDAIISVILEYINEHYSDPNISAGMVADKYHISISHFSRTFKAQVGSSFPDYLSQMRLSAANDLLKKHQEMSIACIAHSVGYLNASYFTAQYKKKYSITPTQYRKKLLIENEHKLHQK